MDINDSQFEAYQASFEALANQLDDLKGPQPDISGAKLHLCLYGENLLSPEEEFKRIKELESFLGKGLKKAVIQTGYWEDVILYVPQSV